MKVLFTGCTFSDETLKRLEEKNIFVTNGRMDYTEQELNDKLTIKPKDNEQKFKIYPSNNIKYKFDSKFRLVFESIKRK